MPATPTNTKAAARAAAVLPTDAPPFWELEELIAQGRTLEQALVIMISRRDGVPKAVSERSRKIARQWSKPGGAAYRTITALSA